MVSAMAYRVYENYPHNKAMVHNAACRFCNDGRGVRDLANSREVMRHGLSNGRHSAQIKDRNIGQADVRDGMAYLK